MSTQRNKRPPKRSGQGSKSNNALVKQNKGLKIGIMFAVIAAGLVTVLWSDAEYNWTGLNFFGTGDEGGTTTTSAFALTLYDPLLGKNLDLDDFDATVWRLPISGDWTDRVQMETGTLASISEADIRLPDDGSACMFVVDYNGTVPHSDTLYGEEHDWGARDYYRRMARIYRGQANQLDSYQTPGSANIIVTNLESCAFINVTADNVTTSANISITVMTNASQPLSQYKAFYDYAAMDWVKPYILFTANATINSTSFSVSGDVEQSLPSTTTKLVEFETLGATPSIFEMHWDPDTPNTVQINTAQLGFSTVLASAGS